MKINLKKKSYWGKKVTNTNGLNATLQNQINECCAYNNCIECIDNKNDEIINKKGIIDENNQIKTPVLFIHGHAFNDANTPEYTMNSFGAIQKKLQSEGFLNAGQLDLSKSFYDIKNENWGKFGVPVTARASFSLETMNWLAE